MAAIIIVAATGCQQGEQTEPKDLLWVEKSAEYAALCKQVYESAWSAVKPVAAEQTEPWAVVFDVDETVLSNSPYQRQLFLDNQSYPHYWNDWVNSATCPLIPGALEFIDSVRTLGPLAHVVFITNRKAELHEGTLQNLKSTGLWQDGDVLMCRESEADTKLLRRNEVESGTGRCADLGACNILALFGDQATDFEELPNVDSVPEIIAYYSSNDKWGAKYFMLPNPMYGYWERGY